MNHSFQKWISRSVSVVAGLAFTAMVQADVVVDTQAGQLGGFEHDSRDVYVFKGVHYDQDTSGERRFKPALPVAAWDGVRDADRFGDVCPQGGEPGGEAFAESGNAGLLDAVLALQALPFATVLAAVTETGRTSVALSPVVDGVVLPDNMFMGESAPSAHGVPMMVGANKDEHTLYAPDSDRNMTEDDLLVSIQNAYGQQAEYLIDQYSDSRPDASPWEIWVAVNSARVTQGSNMLAAVHQAWGPVYNYVFEFPASERLMAAHGAEISFVFSNATSSPNARPGADKVEDAMSEAWIHFARHGNPGHDGIPEWPTYDLESRAAMVFDVDTRVEYDLRPLERVAHERVGIR